MDASYDFLTAVDEMYHHRYVLDRTQLMLRFRRVVDQLWPYGHPTRLVQVVGTNGKGTCCAYLEYAFGRLGQRSGALISPHIIDVRERWRIGGQPVDDRLIAAEWRQRIAPALGAADLRLHFHDIAILLALALFERAGVQWAAVECGIGGRYDRTTTLDRSGVIITGVGDDHRRALGDTAWQRMLNKSGAAIAGMPLVLGQRWPAELWSHLSPAPMISTVPASADIEGFGDDPRRQHSAALVAEMLRLLGFEPHASSSASQEAVASVRLPGRADEVRPGLFVDMAHDRDAVEALVRRLSALDATRRPRQALVGVSKHRSGALLAPLADLVSRIVVTSAPPHGRPADEVADELRQALPSGTQVEVSSASELSDAVELVNDAPTIVCGSSQLAAGIYRSLDPSHDHRLAYLDENLGWRDR